MMDLPLVGESIARIGFDFAVTLLTSGGAELRVETAFAITGEDLSSTSVSPVAAGPHASLLLGLLHREITGATVSQDGTLRLSLGGGGTVEVDPDDKFEAWTFAGPKGEKAVCLPGGGVTTWGLT
jgi:hypothetical protein